MFRVSRFVFRVMFVCLLVCRYRHPHSHRITLALVLSFTSTCHGPRVRDAYVSIIYIRVGPVGCTCTCMYIYMCSVLGLSLVLTLMLREERVFLFVCARVFRES